MGGGGDKWSPFVIWAKNTFTMGRANYQRQYEPILYGWKDGAQHYWCGARDGALCFRKKRIQVASLLRCLVVDFLAEIVRGLQIAYRDG